MPEINLAVLAPDQTALNASAQAFLATANDLVIDSYEMYQVAANELAANKGKAKGLEEQRTKLVAPLNQVVKDINAMFKPPLEFLAQAEGIIKRSMLTYQETEERKRREAEARARAEAEAEAAKERARIEAEAAAARERAAAEQARLEQERQKALAAGNTAQAAKIEAKAAGAAEAADAKQEALAGIAANVQAAPVVLPSSEPPRAKGISTRSKWRAELRDKHALVRFIADNPQYLNLLDFNQSAANQMATALKENLCVAGLTVIEDKLMAARAA